MTSAAGRMTGGGGGVGTSVEVVVFVVLSTSKSVDGLRLISLGFLYMSGSSMVASLSSSSGITGVDCMCVCDVREAQ